MLRLATEEDFPNLLRMARLFHAASPYSDLEFDESSCREVLDAHLRDPSQTIVIMFDHGFIVGLRFVPPFSTDAVTSELAWWVDPEFRDGRESVSLMKAYQDWSVRVGARMTQMAMLDSVTELDRFYRRHGFTPAERSYIRRNF